MHVVFLYNESSEDPSLAAEEADPTRSPIIDALRRLGHDVTAIPCTLDLSVARRRLLRAKPDVVLNRVESLGGSDAMMGALPLLLETLHIPYTGCTGDALAATASKLAVKQRLVRAGLPTPPWIGDWRLGAGDWGLFSQPPVPSLQPRFLLKSVYEHASFQISDAAVVEAESASNVAEAIQQREAETGRPFFAEQFIEGREFNVSVWGNEPELLPPAEIDFSAFPAGKPHIVAHGAKWDAWSFEYHNTPRRFDFPPADAPLLHRLRELTLDCAQLFNLYGGYARVDFRCDADGRPWILEINTNPCLSPDAGFAAALEQGGFDFDAAIAQLLEDAMNRCQRVARTLPAITNHHSFARSQDASVCEAQEAIRVASCRCATQTRSDQAILIAAPMGGTCPDYPIPNCHFRDEVRPQDRDDVRALVASTGFFRRDEIDIAVELVEERLNRGAASGYEFVFAELDGALAGFACYGRIPCTTGSFDLFWIAVDPQYQRHGVGRALVAAVESRIRILAGQQVYVDTSGKDQYAPTRAFYERTGFCCEARLKDFYAVGDDRVIYCKRLSGEYPAADSSDSLSH